MQFYYQIFCNLLYAPGLKVETSSNIFTENLHATRNLETTYYVTDNTQATDFFWVRESSLQVHIGIHDVHLIPEYEDVDHESDNRYMLHSPQQTSQSSEEIQQFRKVLRNYCRWVCSLFTFTDIIFLISW